MSIALSLTTTDSTEVEVDLPVLGLGSYLFYMIHVTALVALPISATFSLGVLIYLHPDKNFFSRPIGDRIVVYLALCDLLFSISHIMDHSYMVATRDHPPDIPCAFFAFFLNQFVLAQSLVVVFSALNAFALVVFSKKIPIGRYDSGLMLYAMGLPFLLGLIGTTTGHFGPTGPWCYIDMRKPLGPLLNNLIAIVMLITFIFTAVCYIGIWLKIRQVSQLKTGNKKYQKTARVMMLFVAAYIFQWWAFVVFATWGLFGLAHPAIMFSSTFFSNLGGVFNFLAYTFIKKRYQNAVEGSDTHSSNTEPVKPIRS